MPALERFVSKKHLWFDESPVGLTKQKKFREEWKKKTAHLLFFGEIFTFWVFVWYVLIFVLEMFGIIWG